MNREKSTSNAWETALDLLSRRDRSETDLRRRLQRKGFEDEQIDAAISRCQRFGYLDDARFAQQRARSLQRSGRAVGRRLQLELKRAGVSEADAEQAIEQTQDEDEHLEVLQQILQRRYPSFDYAQADARTKRRVFDYFLRRGFTREQIFRVLSADDTA